MCSIPYISETRVRELLTWEKTIDAVQHAMAGVANNHAFQAARSVLKLGDSSNLMFVMAGYLESNKYPGLGHKVFTIFPNNPTRDVQPPLPALIANITLLDHRSGEPKAIIAANEITEWRTAAASLIATKHLHGGSKEHDILAILGAGRQGRAHAIAFQRYFNFKEVRIWNRTPQRAQDLADELNKGKSSQIFTAVASVEECLKDADVVVTATDGGTTLVKLEWLKEDVHINAVAVNPSNLELEGAVYKASNVYVDHWDGANRELGHIKKLGVEFTCQIGDLIVGMVPTPSPNTRTIFQSLGMAVEDCAMARLIYDMHVGRRTAINK